jgi:UDP-glucose:(heptosyl)LPS alpha-1,3-glucosyltransferase
MKVGIAVRNFSLMTGVSRVVGELAKRLPGEGVEALILANRLPREKFDGAAVEKVRMLTLSSTLRAASFDWLARRRLAGRVDLVHGHGDLTRQDVLSVHNCDAAAARHVPDGRRPSGGVDYVRRRQFDGCRLVIADSEMVRRDLAEFYGVDAAKVRTVYYGVDLERFHPRRRPEARAALLAAAGWPAETRVVLAVLSGDPAKRNFPLLARAVRRLAEKGPAALCVVGNADWESNEDARALRDRGRLHAAPATPEVERYFAAGDVLALPAFYEEFGLTVLEALASGCPAVVSRRCGAAEVVADGKTGYVFDDLKEPEELIDRLEKAPSLDGAACRAAAEKFTWARHAAETARVYREAAGGR